jgi:hypothetical protein
MRAPINLLRDPVAALHQRYAIRYLASQMRNCLRGVGSGITRFAHEPTPKLRFRNPGSQGDRLVVHSGLVTTNLKVSLHRNYVVCAPCALLSNRSLQFTEALI